MPWSLAIFWGIADWYLWGLLAFAIFAGVRHVKNCSWTLQVRVVLYALSAPFVAALHVVLTMIVGGIGDSPVELGWVGYFQALFAKKITKFFECNRRAPTVWR